MEADNLPVEKTTFKSRIKKIGLVGAGIATAAVLTLSSADKSGASTPNIENPDTFDKISLQYSTDTSEAGVDPTPSRIKPPHTGSAGMQIKISPDRSTDK